MEEIMSVILIEEKTFIKLARTMLDWDSLRSKDNEDKYYEVYKTLRKTNRTELIDKVYKLHVQNTKTYNKNYKKRNEVLKIDELFKGLISQETYALGNNKEQNTLKLIKSILIYSFIYQMIAKHKIIISILLIFTSLVSILNSPDF
jgi:hypothetical protein